MEKTREEEAESTVCAPPSVTLPFCLGPTQEERVSAQAGTEGLTATQNYWERGSGNAKDSKYFYRPCFSFIVVKKKNTLNNVWKGCKESFIFKFKKFLKINSSYALIFWKSTDYDTL